MTETMREHIRRTGHQRYDARRGDLGWICRACGAHVADDPPGLVGAAW